MAGIDEGTRSEGVDAVFLGEECDAAADQVLPVFVGQMGRAESFLRVNRGGRLLQRSTGPINETVSHRDIP